MTLPAYSHSCRSLQLANRLADRRFPVGASRVSGDPASSSFNLLEPTRRRSLPTRDALSSPSARQTRPLPSSAPSPCAGWLSPPKSLEQMASTETLSRTPPIPPRNPFRRLSTSNKALPALPTQSFHIETELIPKPLFSRRTTLPAKAVHVATVELPAPGLSPIILASDTSTISSNRSSIVSVASSRPSTATTLAPSEPPSRTSSFTSASHAPAWVPPPHLTKPTFGRSKTLPARSNPIAKQEPIQHRPISSVFAFEPSIKVPALKLPPTRTSCFSPSPVWTPPKRAPDPMPKQSLRRKGTPRKETLRSLRARDSVASFQARDSIGSFQSMTSQTTPDRQPLLSRAQTDPVKKRAPPKPITLTNMRTYSMDAKGVFILSD
jgi:hypothetical protein